MTTDYKAVELIPLPLPPSLGPSFFPLSPLHVAAAATATAPLYCRAYPRLEANELTNTTTASKAV